MNNIAAQINKSKIKNYKTFNKRSDLISYETNILFNTKRQELTDIFEICNALNGNGYIIPTGRTATHIINYDGFTLVVQSRLTTDKLTIVHYDGTCFKIYGSVDPMEIAEIHYNLSDSVFKFLITLNGTFKNIYEHKVAFSKALNEIKPY